MNNSQLGIDMNWSNTREGKDEIFKLNKRFGLLDPPPQLKNKSHSFKLMMSGKAAVGKTTVLYLLNNLQPPQIHAPSSGLTVWTRYWPVKMLLSTRGVDTVKLDIFDVGSSTLPNYVDVCKEGLDGIIYVFSFKDKSSFLATLNEMNTSDCATKIILGTKYDCKDCDINMEEIKDFEKRTKAIVMVIPEKEDSDVYSNILNHICSQLLSNKKISLDDVKTKYKL